MHVKKVYPSNTTTRSRRSQRASATMDVYANRCCGRSNDLFLGQLARKPHQIRVIVRGECAVLELHRHPIMLRLYAHNFGAIVSRHANVGGSPGLPKHHHRVAFMKIMRTVLGMRKPGKQTRSACLRPDTGSSCSCSCSSSASCCCAGQCHGGDNSCSCSTSNHRFALLRVLALTRGTRRRSAVCLRVRLAGNLCRLSIAR